MIPNQWYILMESKQVRDRPVGVTRMGEKMVLRFYQKFLRVPLLGDLVTWLAMPFNRLIAHQDRRVVETHQPQPSGLRIGERLIQGDRPIVEYRRREQLLKSARGGGET